MRYARNYIEQALAEIRQAITSVEDRIGVNRIEHEALTGELGELARASEVLSALVDEPTREPTVEDEPPAPKPQSAYVVHVPTKRRSATEFRRSVLDFLSAGSRQPFEIRRHTQSNDKATARRNLNAMSDAGLVEATGETHSRRYAITAAGRDWLAASNVMSGESKPVDDEPETPEPESLPANRIDDAPFDEPETRIDGEPEPYDDADVEYEPFEPEPSAAPPDPQPIRAKQYKPGHRVERPKTEKPSGEPGFWVGRDRQSLGEESRRRAETMSATREGRQIKGLPYMAEDRKHG